MADKSRQAWDAFVATLSTDARLAANTNAAQALSLSPVAIPEDCDDEFQRFRSSLSTSAREALDRLAGAPPSEAEPSVTVQPSYCLVESPDGGWATMRLFRTPEALAQRVGQLEGSDTVVWAVYGVPIPITTGMQRYLHLPDGQTSIMVPPYDGGPCRQVRTDLVEGLQIQFDGYVGPRELSETPSIPERDLVRAGKASRRSNNDNDNDDDETADV